MPTQWRRWGQLPRARKPRESEETFRGAPDLHVMLGPSHNHPSYYPLGTRLPSARLGGPCGQVLFPQATSSFSPTWMNHFVLLRFSNKLLTLLGGKTSTENLLPHHAGLFWGCELMAQAEGQACCRQPLDLRLTCSTHWGLSSR